MTTLEESFLGLLLELVLVLSDVEVLGNFAGGECPGETAAVLSGKL